MTSRNIHDIQRLKRSLQSSATLTCIEIPVQDSINDIRRYIESRIDSLPHFAGREELASRILSKSNACFLWVRLVLGELETVYSSESIADILEQIPEGMVPYYERIIKAMSARTREKHIAQAVFVWTVACARRLTVQELSQALELDINTVLPNAKNAVEGLCGQFVTVDENSGVVDLVHQTAREFLLSEAAGEFRVMMSGSDERIALACLQLLSGNELCPPRNPRFIAHARPESSPFLSYAMIQFSEHIYTASSEKDKFLAALDQFFRTNALSWIERLSLRGNLHTLIRTSKNLSAYLERRAEFLSPTSSQAKNIDRWSTDLSRLVTRFGDALTQESSSIHFLIPPLCPSTSAIHNQFGQRRDGLSLVGHKNTTWDDCIAYVEFGDDRASSLSCYDNLIAVGMKSGDLHLYNHRSCQKEAVIHHSKPVMLVHLTDGHIALCTTTAIVFQDMSGITTWENRLRFQCHCLTSSDDRIIAVSQYGHLLEWDRGTGELLRDQEFKFRNYEFTGLHNARTDRVPQFASISPDLETAALSYRGGTVCLWNVREVEFIGWARDEDGRRAVKLLFNPDPNINLLLIIYSDHGFALYETWSGSLVHSRAMPKEVGLLSASCSPDGRTFATIDTVSNMYIWDFESLSVLYHIRSPFPSFRILGFTSNGTSVIDVMRSSMRIWSPVVLVREEVQGDTSTRSDAIQLAITESTHESHQNAEVTVMGAHPSAPIVFAGKSNGEVVLFDTKEGVTTVIYSHSASIMSLDVSKNYTIASADVYGIVQIRSFQRAASIANSDSSLLAEIRAQTAVKQLCFSADGRHLLVGSMTSDSVYRVRDGSRVGTFKFEFEERTIWRWLLSHRHGQAYQEFWLFSDGIIKSFSAETFPSPGIDNTPEIRLEYAFDEACVETDVDTLVVHPSSKTLALEVRHKSGFAWASTTLLFDLSEVIPSSTTPNIVTLTPMSTVIHRQCKHFLGFSEESRSLVFLHKNSWLSSISIPGLIEMRYIQHFFVPSDYLSSNNSAIVLPPVKTANDDVVFCLHEELISVRNGLKFRNVISVE